MDNWLSELFFSNHVLSSVIYVVLLLIMRYFAEQSILKSSSTWSQEERLKAVGSVRSVVFGFLIFGIAYIWAEEIRAFAVSVFAIAVALVMALKELILCVHGYIILIRHHIYALGDRIQLSDIRGQADIRGQVISINLLSTTMLEIGPKPNGQALTGRTLSFPNSILLTYFVVNDAYMEKFANATLEIPLSIDEDWQLAKMLLLEIAQQECEPFLQKAAKKAQEQARKQGVEFPSVEPKITVSYTEHKRVDLSLRMVVPSYLREDLQQSVLSRFLASFYKNSSKTNSISAL